MTSDSLTVSEAARLKRWIRVLGWVEIVAHLGLNESTINNASRRRKISARSLARIRPLTDLDPPALAAPKCLDCDAEIEGAHPFRPRLRCEACQKKRDQIYHKTRYERGRTARQRREAPPPVVAPTIAAQCPACAVPLKRDGILHYCPQRCGYSALIRRSA